MSPDQPPKEIQYCVHGNNADLCMENCKKTTCGHACQSHKQNCHEKRCLCAGIST
jgi:hypothetical protein